jgi:hypothetical protein
MASLFFPQLTSGALAQYPVKKTRLVRTIKNVLPDGNMVLSPDPNASHLIWQLSYTGLETADTQALQSHMASCSGPFRAFTFIDPTENMLVWSSNLQNAPWQSSSLISFQTSVADPDGGTGAVMVTNLGQQSLSINQTLTVPANYQYCFSVYVTSVQPSLVTLTTGLAAPAQETTSFAVNAGWSRLIWSGRLADTGTQFYVAINLAAGQQVSIYGPQLEPQLSPSRYRPTGSWGGVYANAHWGVEQLTTIADAPGLYSTSFSIETSIKD